MAYRQPLEWGRPPGAPLPPAYRASAATSRALTALAAAASRALAALAVGGFLLVVRHVLTHDPGPGLSGRGWLTLGVAASVLILLRAHRGRRGRPPRPSRVPLTRAAAEYATVALLVVLLASPAPATTPIKAATRSSTRDAPADERPATAEAADTGVVAVVGDWLAELARQAKQQPAPPPSTAPKEHRP